VNEEIGENSTMVVIKEVKVKSVLSRSRIYAVDYSINPYIGCEHACVYCFARHMCNKPEVRRNWGKLVYVKINAPRVLKKEVKSGKYGTVLMSSVTDPYQPIERKYEISRRLLEILCKTKLSVIIMTKSDLVTRDVHIIKKLNGAEVGITITTMSEAVSDVIEPEAPPVNRRIKTLSTLTDHGIKTFVFMGPFIPVVSEMGISSLISELSSIGVNRIIVDTLNVKRTNLSELLDKLSSIVSSREINFIHDVLTNRRLYSIYYQRVKGLMGYLSKRYKINVDFAY